MAMMPLAYPASSNRGRYGDDGTARLINCYIESRGKEGKEPLTLYCSEGLSLFSDLGTDLPVRGGIGIDHVAYVVAGNTLYRVDASGGSRSLGTIAGQRPVYMARNRHSPFQLSIVASDGFDYVVEGDVLTRNPDQDLISPNSNCFLNGYIVFSHLDGRITSTAIDNATDVNPLDYDTAEFSADRLLRVVSRGSEFWAFGEDTIEIWQPAGGEGLPFLRTEVIQKGCLSGGSVQEIDAAVLWVAEDKTVRMARGYDAGRISNHAVEISLKTVTDGGALVSSSWHDGGHTFYAISGDDFTWVYDLTTGLWHERQSHGDKRWRCGVSFRFQGKNMFGDRLSGKIFELDQEATAEGDEPLIANITLPLAHASPGRLMMNEIIIDAITPQLTEAGASLTLKVSKDAGRSWSIERQCSLEDTHHTRVKSNRFGTSRKLGFAVNITSSAAHLRAITGIYADLQKIGR